MGTPAKRVTLQEDDKGWSNAACDVHEHLALAGVVCALLTRAGACAASTATGVRDADDQEAPLDEEDRAQLQGFLDDDTEQERREQEQYARGLKLLLDSFTPEQHERHAIYRRSKFKPNNIRKVSIAPKHHRPIQSKPGHSIANA
ncbi:uncharacterized protein MONBRDRAFT_12145 [Monosiga brevicollis MX1]|uniref:Uncharacterized protein n=1 Tax=Monosiga brevicollis TaxID=81824 RepID=A9VBC8_MONBE|nr:uncharacterized protein MONBRDRAFT_12145 [Monosiga brevicollis MX1]EDQ85214.1 predicted protein [Monosiga brevicollis MX1]|eukprot:XP_001750039.1 hypothetical protein [Monosiga brevicollis MX1]